MAKDFQQRLAEAKRELENKFTEVRKVVESLTTEAKTAANNAAASATDSASALVETVTESVNHLKENVEDTVTHLRAATTDKLKERMKEIEDFVPTLTKLGYKVVGVEVALEIPPSVKLLLKGESLVTQDEAEKILNEQKQKSMLLTLIAAVMQTERLKVSGLNCEEIELVLGILPKAIMKFK